VFGSDPLIDQLFAVGFASLGMIAAAGCTKRPAADAAAPLAVELAAARSVLASYRPGAITVDPEYAPPQQAPPSASGKYRPDHRQRAVTEALRTATQEGGGDTLRVRASEPVIEGRSAAISVTVDGSLASGHPGAFYETIQFELQRTDRGWSVHKREQLGIS
jgi:hypothetical protein